MVVVVTYALESGLPLCSICQRSRRIRLSTSSRNRLSCERLEVLRLVAGDDAYEAEGVLMVAHDLRQIEYPLYMTKSVERKFWKTWNKMVLPGIYIILMTVEKTKTRGEHICQIR